MEVLGFRLENVNGTGGWEIDEFVRSIWRKKPCLGGEALLEQTSSTAKRALMLWNGKFFRNAFGAENFRIVLD
ncbi:MAG: hypothetical protein ACTS4U_00810 [Candidatus Hodgkinia cicadicola]